MKATVTAAFIMLCIASAALPAPAAEQQDKKVRKIVTIGKHTGGAWLGVALQDVTDEIAKDKHLSVKSGALVTEVVADSPADSAGVKEQDVIVEVGGTAIASANDVIKRVREMKTDETAAVVVLRDGAKKTISVKLGGRPEEMGRMEMRMPSMPSMPHMGSMPNMPHWPPTAGVMKHSGVEGMQLLELTDQLGKYFDAPDNKALLVANVKKNSNARKAGIEAGDVIFRAGRMDIEDMSDLHSALKEAKDGSTVDVQLIRKGARKTVKLEMSKREEAKMNFHGSFPDMRKFNFDHFGFDRQEFRDQLRDLMKDLKPEMDRIRKHVRIRVEDGKVIKEETREKEEEGTEL